MIERWPATGETDPVTFDMLRLWVTALPRQQKRAVSGWLDGLTRGTLGPIDERFSELQVECLKLPIEQVRALRDYAAELSGGDDPEHVGSVLARTVAAIRGAVRRPWEDGEGEEPSSGRTCDPRP